MLLAVTSPFLSFGRKGFPGQVAQRSLDLNLRGAEALIQKQKSIMVAFLTA